MNCTFLCVSKPCFKTVFKFMTTVYKNKILKTTKHGFKTMFLARKCCYLSINAPQEETELKCVVFSYIVAWEHIENYTLLEEWPWIGDTVCWMNQHLPWTWTWADLTLETNLSIVEKLSHNVTVKRVTTDRHVQLHNMKAPFISAEVSIGGGGGGRGQMPPHKNIGVANIVLPPPPPQ